MSGANENPMKLFAAQLEHRRLKMRASKLEKLLAAMDGRVTSLYEKVGDIMEAGCENDATETSTAKDDVVPSELAAKICSSVPGFSRAMDKFQKTWQIFQAVLVSLDGDMQEMHRVWKCAKAERRQVAKLPWDLEERAAARVELVRDGGDDLETPADGAVLKRGRSLARSGRSQASKLAKLFPAGEQEPVYKLSRMERESQ